MQVYHLNYTFGQAFSAPAVALYQRLGDTDTAWYARVRRGQNMIGLTRHSTAYTVNVISNHGFVGEILGIFRTPYFLNLQGIVFLQKGPSPEAKSPIFHAIWSPYRRG